MKSITEKSEIFKEDKEYYKKTLEHDIKSGRPINLFYSFTHITPTYTLLFVLNELKRLADTGNFKIFIVVWDTNALENPYMKDMIASKRIKDPKAFLEEKNKELKSIIKAVGFKEGEVEVYKSSELWRNVINHREEDLFQMFYSTMASMKTDEFPNHKMSHIAQSTIDLILCRFWNKLLPEDTKRRIDILFIGVGRKEIYTKLREVMKRNGILNDDKPVFRVIKEYPFLEHRDNIPNFDSSKSEIRDIVRNCKIELDKDKLFLLSSYLFDEENFKEFYEKNKDLEVNELKELFSDKLYSYLRDYKRKFLEIQNDKEEDILKLKELSKLKDFGNVLRSDIALKIMLLADGTKSPTEISKHLGKPKATIRRYTNRLRKLDLIRTLSDGSLRRNIKGVKINLESGLESFKNGK